MIYIYIILAILLLIGGWVILRWSRIKRMFKLINCDCDKRGCYKCLID